MKRIILFFAVCLGLSGIWTDSFCATNNLRTATKRTTANTTTVADKNVSRTTKSRTNTRTTNSTTNTRTQQKTVQTRKTNQNVKLRTATPTVKSRTTNGATTRTATTRQTKSNGAVASRVASSKTVAMATRASELNMDKINDIKSKDYSKCKTVYFECMDEFCANKDSSLRRCACSSRIHEFDDIKQQLSDAEDKMADFNQRLLTVSLAKEDAAAINVASEGEDAFYNTKDKSESEKMLKKITDALNSSGNSRINNDLSSISLSLNMDSAWDNVDSMAGISTTSKSGIDLYNAARPVCVEMAKEVCSNDEISVVQSSYQLSIQQDCNTVAKSYSSQYNQAKEKIYESSALLDMARLNVYQTNNSDDVLTCKKKILEQLSDETVCGQNLYKCLDTTGQYINPSTGAAFLSARLYNLTNLLIAPTGDVTWSKVSQNEPFVKFLNSKRAYLKTAISQCRDMADVVWDDFINDALSQIKLAQNAKLEEIRQSCTTLVAQCKTGTQTSLNEFDARALSTFNVLSDTTVNAMCAQVQSSCTSLMENSGGGADEWNKGVTDIAVDTSYAKILETCMVAGKDCIIQKCNGSSGNFALCGDYSSAPRRAILTRTACWKDVYDCVKQSSNADKIKPFYVQGMGESLSVADRREPFYKAMYWIDKNNVPKGITTTLTYLTGITTTGTPNCEESQHLTNGVCEYDAIPKFCDRLTNDDDKNACFITEQIWGNCHFDPEETAITTNENLYTTTIRPYNTILTPLSGETLLSWFAEQTGTTTNKDSCSAYKCPINYQYANSTCVPFVSDTSATHIYLDKTDKTIKTVADLINAVGKNNKNYCPLGAKSKDSYRNCCIIETGANEYVGKVDGSRPRICVPDYGNTEYTATFIRTITCVQSYTPDTTPTDTTTPINNDYCGKYTYNTTNGKYERENSTSFNLYCIHSGDYSVGSPNNNTSGNTTNNTATNQFECPGYYVLIDQYGNYVNPSYEATSGVNIPKVHMLSYVQQNNTDTVTIYDYDYNTQSYNSCNWNDTNNTVDCDPLVHTNPNDFPALPTGEEFIIYYDE